MKTQLIISCALLLILAAPVAAASDGRLPCSYSNYEYVCLVHSRTCLDGGTEDKLVIFEPETMRLDASKTCKVLLKLKNIDNTKWAIDLEYKDFEGEAHIQLKGSNGGSETLMKCHENAQNSKEFKLDPWIWPHFSPKLNGNGKRAAEVSHNENDPTKKLEMREAFLKYKSIEVLNSDTEAERIRSFTFKGDMTDLVDKVTGTRGCNPALAKVAMETVEKGETVKMETRLVGWEAKVTCEQKSNDVLEIKPKDAQEWFKVRSIFCADLAWAYETFEGKPEYMGGDEFDLKCTRIYTMFCGMIHDELCLRNCRKVADYSTGVPKCPNDLWYWSKDVIKSELKCKESPGNPETGAWTAEINGVEHAVRMGSCYVGPWPIPQEIPSSAAAPSVWPILLASSVLLLM